MIKGPVWLMQPIPYFGEMIKGKWIYEPKIDGWRMQILRYKTGRIEIWGRRLERKPNWTKKLPDLIDIARDVIPKGVLLDCELYSTGGRRFIPSLFAKTPKVKPVVYVFDILFFEDKQIYNLPLMKRKQILKTLKLINPFFVLEVKRLSDIIKNYKTEVKKGHEGIVIKKLNSPYLIGKQAPIATHHWRKIK